MKVIHIITDLATGGAERALYNLLQGGLSTAFDSHVISLCDAGTMGSQIEALGVPVTTLEMRAGRPSFKGLLKLHTTIKTCQPDLIQGWMYHGNLVATLVRTMFSERAVLVWNIRQSLYLIDKEKLLTRQVIRANRFLSRSPDVLMYNSQLSRQQHEVYGFVVNKGRVIPNGIDVQQFSFSAASRQRVRAELNIPTDALVIGHVARLHPMKDHPVFMEAVVGLAIRYPQVHVLLSGRNVTLKNQSLAKLIPLNICDRFHLLNERHDVPDLMSAMDIFCLCSAWGEGFPNVLGEAMATGIPCVTTDVGDSSLIIGDTGVLVPPSNMQYLATGIESLLIKSGAERYALGAKARARIEDNFTLDAIVDQYTMMYEQLIAGNEKGKSCVES